MDKASAIERRDAQRRVIPSLQSMRRGSDEFKKWYRDSTVAIRYVFGDGHHLKEFETVRYSLSVFSSGTPDSAFQEAYLKGLGQAGAVLASMIDEVRTYWKDTDDKNEDASPDPIARIEHLCVRFPLVARQLRDRHAGRPTVEITDEYDVQDLFHAILHVDFDDIRPEEWTPSYAGGSSRMDFLLKSEQIVVELKKTRKGLGAREVGEQLIIDIERYSAHPECKTLVCFVYDPDMLIANPRGLERDLTRVREGLDVRILVIPRGA